MNIFCLFYSFYDNIRTKNTTSVSIIIIKMSCLFFTFILVIFTLSRSSQDANPNPTYKKYVKKYSKAGVAIFLPGVERVQNLTPGTSVRT